jgi:hypothetical protein
LIIARDQSEQDKAKLMKLPEFTPWARTSPINMVYCIQTVSAILCGSNET